MKCRALVIAFASAHWLSRLPNAELDSSRISSAAMINAVLLGVGVPAGGVALRLLRALTMSCLSGNASGRIVVLLTIQSIAWSIRFGLVASTSYISGDSQYGAMFCRAAPANVPLAPLA